MHVLVTGSSGLIGSEAVTFFDGIDARVTGVDNNARADFFGPNGDTTWNRQRLERVCSDFHHRDLDIRHRDEMFRLFASESFDLIIHTAAQPSHDLAARRPLDDFDINAVGTLNLLEATRQHAPEAVFIYVSTNKVYGDGPNRIALEELDTRWDYAEPAYQYGIAEDFPVDQCLHSLFGVSKLSGDLLAQEYGRYFGLKTGIFRGGCLTGPHHAGVELHGFLSYLTAVALSEGNYTIYGYGGKQVRDQIHSSDVIRAFWAFAQNPRPGEVYNIGGGKQNAASLLECVSEIERRSGRRPELHYRDEPRVGDHIVYYTDLRKLQRHYPDWRLQYSFHDILDEMIASILKAGAD